MPEKLIIIGSGPSGWTAAIYAARAALQPLVFEGAITASTLPMGQLYLTTEVENFPGFPAGHMDALLDSAIAADRRGMLPPRSGEGIHGPELMELMRQQAVNFGTRIVTEDVASVDFGVHPFKLTASDGNAFEALSVIVATGARANYLGLPSEEKYKNRGVSACAICDGALPRFRNRALVVIGGGDAAVEEAAYLAKFASTVYLVHRRDQLRASKIMARRALDDPKIKVLWNREMVEVLGADKDGVTGVRLASTTGESELQLDCSGVFLGIGHTPNTAFLKGQLDLTPKGYVQWTSPPRTCTSVDGVFAAGDVADDYYRQAITAAGTGCMSALDAERWLSERGV
jgi:thioredoxin reductase (NADPH)